MAPAPIAFLHLHRTGGVSLWTMLKLSYHRRALRINVTGALPAGLAAGIRPKVRYIAGHMNWGLHEQLPVRYATVLRDPIERALSNYEYWRAKREAAGLGAPFEDGGPVGERGFLSRPHASNLQSQMLAGVFRLMPKRPAGEALDLARQHLEEFFAVGFFDDLPGFARVLGLEDELPRANGVSRSFEPTRDQLERLRAQNQADIELYAWARARFATPQGGGMG